MRYVEIVLRPLSDWMTPWQADTVFGHIAWAIRYEQGEKALVDWLHRFEGDEPPFVLSDGFIGAWLPRPLLPPRIGSGHTSLDARELQEAKKRKSLRWIHREALLRGELDITASLSKQGDALSRTVHHNVIDRRTGASLSEDDGLYAVEQFTLPEGETTLSFYAAVPDEAALEQLQQHFEKLGVTGFGKRKSVGMGHFKVVEILQRDDWFQRKPTNAHMWLGHGVPAPGDPTRGYYRLATKYGKLAEGWNHSASIFKRPLTRITPGSIFYSPEPAKSWSGSMVRGISELHPGVMQYGLTLTLPLRLEENFVDTMVTGNAGRF